MESLFPRLLKLYKNQTEAAAHPKKFMAPQNLPTYENKTIQEYFSMPYISEFLLNMCNTPCLEYMQRIQ